MGGAGSKRVEGVCRMAFGPWRHSWGNLWRMAAAVSAGLALLAPAGAQVRELCEIAQAVAALPRANVLFLTGDQHFTNLFAYDVDGDGRVDFHEANTGPLRAGTGSGQVDLALNLRRLYTDEGRVEHTYGVLRIEGESGRLVVQFHDVAGRERAGARLELEPRR